MAKRAVLLGAGHAHLYTIKRAAAFARRGYELTVVAPDTFWYSGLATGMLGGIYPPELDQVDVAALVEHGGGRFLRDRVTGLDRGARQVLLASGAPLSYDALSITLGSEPPAIPGADPSDEHVFAVKPIRRLWELRRAIERRLAVKPTRAPRIAIAGGGATACELAANIAQLAKTRGGGADIAVLAAGGDILAQLPRGAARKVEAALTRRGIRFRRHARVERIGPGHAMTADGSSEPFDFFVNATGLRPAPLIRDLGLPVDESGAMLVDDRLRSPADPLIHGGGDCVAMKAHTLPRIGVYAIRQAPVLFANLLAALGAAEPERFTPQRNYLWVLNLGDGTGLALRGRLYWHGRLAFRLKDWIDRRFLDGYQRAVPRPGA
jgi:NADH dehydrogenase FAD-containing subunit